MDKKIHLARGDTIWIKDKEEETSHICTKALYRKIEFLFGEQLKSGLLKERSAAQEIIEHMEKNGFEIKHEFATSIFEEHSPMRNTLTYALLPS